MDTKFFTFGQNNSGGGFHFDAKRGITHNVIVEATDTEHAIARAEQIGLYWDGVDYGKDCECCGDRWSTWCSEDAVPSVYGTPVAGLTWDQYVAGDSAGWRMKLIDGPEAFIHYLDGRIEGVLA
jgi:hypothetical protein